MNRKAIGVFDSGLGGLAAVKELQKLLPNENIIYFGDTGRMPYGTKSEETIKKYAKEDVEFLLSKNVKAVLAACGTVSSVALDYIKETTDIPIFGVIDEAAKEACRVSEMKNIGVIGTDATINSRKFTEKIQEIEPLARVNRRACPLFVSLVEHGFADKNNEMLHLACKWYLSDFKGVVDTLILGCTHFPLIQESIKEVLPGITIVDPTKEAAKAVAKELSDKGLLSPSRSKGKVKYFVSDDPSRFSSAGKIFLGEGKEIKAKKISF